MNYTNYNHDRRAVLFAVAELLGCCDTLQLAYIGLLPQKRELA